MKDINTKDIDAISPFSQRVREESRKKGITRAKLAEMIKCEPFNY